jgi:hypothetical protein
MLKQISVACNLGGNICRLMSQISARMIMYVRMYVFMYVYMYVIHKTPCSRLTFTRSHFVKDRIVEWPEDKQQNHTYGQHKDIYAISV